MKLVDREDGAKIAGLSYRVFWDYVKRGIIPKHCHTDNRRHMWRVSDVEASASKIIAYKKKTKKQQRDLIKHRLRVIKIEVQKELFPATLELDPFNLFLQRHVKITPTAEVLL